MCVTGTQLLEPPLDASQGLHWLEPKISSQNQDPNPNTPIMVCGPLSCEAPDVGTFLRTKQWDLFHLAEGHTWSLWELE